jgi:excisionase family DNA binding protein
MRYLTTGQVAGQCQVSIVTVKKWIAGGKLKAFRTPGGHYRITAEELRRFRAAHGFPPEREEPPRILVVDDDPSVVEALIEAFRAAFPAAKLEAASDGYEGVLKVGIFRPHLLLLDLRMPGLDGFEVCRRIKIDPMIHATKVIAITAYTEESARERALRCGADAFFTKPPDIEELMTEARRLIE